MSANDETVTAGPTLPSPPLRVLVVEDNAAAAQTTGWLIEMMEFDYRLAGGAEDALTIAADYRPHVIMLDIGLPGMNGFDLCIALRGQPQLQETVFIALTGWTQSHYRERAEAAGFDHYIVKPVTYDALLDILAAIATRL